jgi:hypothetical protein
MTDLTDPVDGLDGFDGISPVPASNGWSTGDGARRSAVRATASWTPGLTRTHGPNPRKEGESHRSRVLVIDA